MKRVGITGGIGSGKSLVCQIFEILGIPVYYADDRAKQLYFKQEIKEKIQSLLGSKAYINNQQIDRKWIAQEVFSSQDKLQALNGILHPAVAEDYRNWEEDQDHAAYILKEAAIMIESGSHQSLDHLILVTAPEGMRIQRVMARDQVTEQEVRSRMEKQMTDKEKLPYSDFVIRNDGSKSLIKQILEIHFDLTKAS